MQQRTQPEKEPDQAPRPPRRASRWGRRLRLAVSVLLVLATFALLGIFAWLPGRTFSAPDWARERVVAWLEANLPDYRFAMAGILLEVGRDWQPRVILQDVAISDAEGRPLVALSDLAATAGLPGRWDEPPPLKGLALSGAMVSLRRDRDGNFDLALGEGASTVLPDADPVTLIEAVDALFLVPPLDTLERVEVDSLTLLYDDQRAGRSWTIDGGRVEFARKDSSLWVLGEFALLGGRDYATTVEVSYESVLGSRAAGFAIDFEGMAAGDLATQSAALTWLSVLDAPISGALVGEYDPDGKPLPVEVALELGAGKVQPTPGARPIRFDAARIAVTYDPVEQIVSVDDVSVQSTFLRLRGAGRAALGDFRGGLPNTYEGQMKLTELAGDPAGLFHEERVLGPVDLAYRLTLAPFRLDLGEAVVSYGDETAILTGRAEAGDEGWDYALAASAAMVRPETVLDFWPVRLGPRARRWVTENILGGEIRNAQLSLRGRASAAVADRPRIYLGFDFSNASVRFLKEMPPILDGEGHFAIEGTRLAVTLGSGTVVPPLGGPITLDGSTFVIPDYRIRGGPGHVGLRAEGTVTAILAMLDQPPFRVMTKAGREVALAGGRARLEGWVRTPLRKGVKYPDVAFHLTGTATNVVSERILPGHRLSAATLNIEADQDRLAISGSGRVGEVPFDGRWEVPLGLPDPMGVFKGHVALSSALLAEFGVEIPGARLSGSARGELAIEMPKGAPAELTLQSDLVGLAMRFVPLGWGKGRDRAGRLDLAATVSDPPVVDRVELAAPGLNLVGGISLSPDGGLGQALFSRVGVGGWFDGRVVLEGRGRGRVPAVRIDGGRVNLARMPDAVGGPGSGGGIGGEVPLTVALDELAVSETIAVRRFRADLVAGAGLSGRFSGLLAGAAPVSGTLKPGPDGTEVHVTSEAAGLVASALGILTGVEDGTMEVDLVPVAGQRRTYDGALTARGVRLRDAPALAALLDALSVVGLLDQLGGAGIFFSDVEARFRVSDRQLVIAHASAIGPSMGVSLDGYYDVTTGRLDLQGVLSPIYMLNAVGAVFTRRGEGLFGFNFRVRGTRDDPRITVNPLSVLTPGMFREIFRRPPPKLE